MRISIHFARVISVQNMKDTNGKIISVSLGKDAGFMRILWTTKKTAFEYAAQIKKGDDISVPFANISYSTYTKNNGDAGVNLVAFTDYVYKLPKFNKDNNKQYENNNDKVNGAKYDPILDEISKGNVENNTEKINWEDDEQLNETIDKAIVNYNGESEKQENNNNDEITKELESILEE